MYNRHCEVITETWLFADFQMILAFFMNFVGTAILSSGLLQFNIFHSAVVDTQCYFLAMLLNQRRLREPCAIYSFPQAWRLTIGT